MSKSKDTGGVYKAPKSNDYTPSEGRGRKTGVVAPRRGTADSMARVAGVSTETKPVNTYNPIPAFPPSGTDWREQNPEYVEPARRSSVSDAGDEILAGLDGLEGLGETNKPQPSGPASGPVSNPYTDAIKILQQRLSGGGYGTSYDNLSTLLGTTSGTARGQIDQATADAIAQMSSRNALATPINYSAGTTQIPQTALSNYLNAIGASTSSVDAGRNFLQGLIDSSASGAAQSQAAQQQAYEAQRQAGISALTGNQQFQQANLSTATQAQQMAIAQAKEKERKALEDQILEYVLKGGVA